MNRPGDAMPGGERHIGMKDMRILIVGGGIGGLTSAIALCRKGFEVEVIERDPDDDAQDRPRDA